jgi:HAD superfamily hydrolase (TIGR01509 family)
VVSAVIHEYGDFAPETVRDAVEGVRGMRPLDGSRVLIDRLDLRSRAVADAGGDGAPPDPVRITPEALLAETAVLLDARWHEVCMMPGARRLLDHLHARDVPAALATSTPSDFLARKMKTHDGWVDRLRVRCTGDEVARGKPAPDIFLLAAERLGADPARCLVVEDTPLGVDAAKAAGMRCVAVPSIPKKRETLYAAADEIVHSLYDLDLERYGLPRFDDWIPSPRPDLREAGERALPLRPVVRMRGPVVRGFGRGSKQLGIPTANLDAGALKKESDALAPGIYFGWASVGPQPATEGPTGGEAGGGENTNAAEEEEDEEANRRPIAERCPMVMSIGWNPFFDDAKKTIEPWLLDETLPEEFYGAELRLTVCAYLRPEANFTTLENLVARIRRDAEVAEAALNAAPFKASAEDEHLTF